MIALLAKLGNKLAAPENALHRNDRHITFICPQVLEILHDWKHARVRFLGLWYGKLLHIS
jgi:hypothetical protein